MNLNNKKVIITGATGGIGNSLVKKFSEAGAKILATGTKEDKLNILKKEFDNIQVEKFNLGEHSKIDPFIELANQKLGGLDVLINNAGSLINKPFLETSAEDFKKVFSTNVFGVAELIKCVIPFMSSEGHVVTISSMGGVQGSMKFAGLSAYSSSKGAVITLTELLAEEYKETGPSFNVLALGAVQTEMLEEAFPGYKASVSADQMANYIFDFSVNGNKLYNGKLMQVSSSTP